jgi:hypothetical protein
MKLLIILNMLWLIIAPFSYATADNQEDVTSRYISMALQGDLSRAEQLFNEAELKNESPAAGDLAKRFQTRFMSRNESLAPETGDDLVDAIVSVYREYWVSRLMHPSAEDNGERVLQRTLGELLRLHQPLSTADGGEDVFAQVGTVLQDRGFYYLEATASPLRDLFLWKQEETRNYDVHLTDRNQPVQVTFMREIYSLGWKEFATLGLVSTTGWVADDRLYCVSWAYDRESENFRVSYLKHEARHLADLQRYPALSSTDLEYRAKLTELAFASTSMRRLLDDFTRKSASNPAAPHAYANFRVVRDIYRSLYSKPVPDTGNPWTNVNPDAVARVARHLLTLNTKELERAH